ncbi:MAG: tetratricopeptide repeat protein [Desulfovibrionaceae bacterium]
MTDKNLHTENLQFSGISEEELQKKTAFELLQHANGASDFLDKTNALYFFDLALKKAPNLPDIYSDRALMQHYRFANMLDSLKDYNEALKKDPTFFPSLFAKATLYFSINEYTLALSNYAEALVFSTDIFFSQTIHLQKAAIYEKQNKYDSAQKEYAQAIALAPSFGRSYFKRARMCYSLSDYGNALLDCNTSLAHNPQCHDTLLLRSYIFTILGDYSLALQDLHSILLSKYYSNQVYTWHNTLISALDILQEYEESHNTTTVLLFKEYVTALTVLLPPSQIYVQLKNDPFLKKYKDPILLYFLSQTFFTLHSYEEALFFIHDAIAISYEDNPHFFFLRASIYFYLTEYILSIEDLLFLLNLDNNTPLYYEAYSLLAKDYIALEEMDYALQCYDALLHLDEGNLNIRKQRAFLYSFIGELQNAITEYEYILQQDNSDKECYKYLGIAHMTLQWFRTATLSFTPYLHYSVTDHEIWYYRSLCYYNRQQYTLALTDITTALLFNPDSIQYLQHRMLVYTALEEYSLSLEDALYYQHLTTQNRETECIAHAKEYIIYLNTMIESSK